MPEGKPAGVRCVQLDDENRCRIFGRPERPAVCGGLQASTEMCGENAEFAMTYLSRLDQLTSSPVIPTERSDEESHPPRFLTPIFEMETFEIPRRFARSG
jgi:hypothetical protein